MSENKTFLKGSVYIYLSLTILSIVIFDFAFEWISELISESEPLPPDPTLVFHYLIPP